jgi:hypothetical protein
MQSFVAALPSAVETLIWLGGCVGMASNAVYAKSSMRELQSVIFEHIKAAPLVPQLLAPPVTELGVKQLVAMMTRLLYRMPEKERHAVLARWAGTAAKEVLNIEQDAIARALAQVHNKKKVKAAKKALKEAPQSLAPDIAHHWLPWLHVVQQLLQAAGQSKMAAKLQGALEQTVSVKAGMKRVVLALKGSNTGEALPRAIYEASRCVQLPQTVEGLSPEDLATAKQQLRTAVRHAFRVGNDACFASLVNFMARLEGTTSLFWMHVRALWTLAAASAEAATQQVPIAEEERAEAEAQLQQHASALEALFE